MRDSWTDAPHAKVQHAEGDVPLVEPVKVELAPPLPLLPPPAPGPRHHTAPVPYPRVPTAAYPGPLNRHSTLYCPFAVGAASAFTMAAVPPWLKVGVKVKIPSKEMEGSVMYVGATKFASGKWVGVNLTNLPTTN